MSWFTKSENVVTRFAPSPTGFLHIGSVRTALFSYLFAKQHSGKFVLRIEDTDKERSKKEHEDEIIAGIKWLGLEYDDFYRQSDRTDIYKKYLQKLIDEGKAYISKEEPKESEHAESSEHGTAKAEQRRAEVIRFKNPNKKVKFADAIRGEIEFDTTELKDFVIAKSLEEPIFHFVVVVDDFEMGITHVIRGEDHISNTPRQMLIQEAIGAPHPTYAHLPLILAEDKAKLSKRKHGEAVSLKYYINKGYLKDAVINFIALLGWNPGTDQELFSMDALIKAFDLAKVQKSGAVFNVEKLNWFNKEYIKKLPITTLQEEVRKRLSRKHAATPDIVEKLTPIIIERITVFSDIDQMMNDGEFEYYFADPEYKPEALLFRGKGDIASMKERLKKAIELLESIPDHDFNKETVKAALWEYATEVGRGDVLWPMRYALSGKEKSPDPFVLAEILGKDVTLSRLEKAIEKK